jgi:hypothetical protein
MQWKTLHTNKTLSKKYHFDNWYLSTLLISEIITAKSNHAGNFIRKLQEKPNRNWTQNKGQCRSHDMKATRASSCTSFTAAKISCYKTLKFCTDFGGKYMFFTLKFACNGNFCLSEREITQ